MSGLNDARERRATRLWRFMLFNLGLALLAGSFFADGLILDGKDLRGEMNESAKCQGILVFSTEGKRWGFNGERPVLEDLCRRRLQKSRLNRLHYQP
jgi:hypothetical protein